MEVKIKTANKGNFGGSRSVNKIKYIVVHYTANMGDTAKNNADYFAREVVKASAHFFVDREEVYQSVPANYVAYAVGGNKLNKNGTLHGIATNANTLSIEMCNPLSRPFTELDEKVASNTQSLVRKMMSEYDIDINHVIRHYDITGKECPKQLLKQYPWLFFKWGCLKVPTKTVTKKSDKTTVSWLQFSLNLTIGANLKIDGIYGTKTKNAVLTFWKSLGWNKLGINDGTRAGKKTINKLCDLVNKLSSI